jgi:hypothetical protein
MKLPPPIQAYIDADGRNDGTAVIASFAPDAVVHDEGKTHVGRVAIESWWRTSKSAYKHSIAPLEATGMGDVVKVLAKITGQFPSSPATLIFAFQLEQDRITELEITP